MARPTGSPNVVLITIESLRADFVGFLNSKEPNTPFLDKLSKESIIFKNAIVSGTPTFFHFPSLMTGKLPFTYGYKLGIPDANGSETIAEVARNNGYKTIAVLGDNPQLYSIYNFDRGFDIYLDGLDRKTKSDLFIINTLWNLKQRLPSGVGNILDTLRAAATILTNAPPNHISAQDLNQKVIPILHKPDSKPIFLWVHYMDAHFPYLSGIDRIEGLFKKIYYYKKLISSITTLKIEDPRLVELVKKAYRGGIAKADKAIGDLYATLIATYPNTIFIITSDHGEGFMDHESFGHEATSLYDELIKVPLLIHLPSKQHRVELSVVSTISLAKTICSLLGISSYPFEGTDLTKRGKDIYINHISKILFNCISPSIRLQIFDPETKIQGFNELVSYTTESYKYITEINGKTEELYYLKSDPGEKRNLIDSTGHSKLITFRKKVQQIYSKQ